MKSKPEEKIRQEELMVNQDGVSDMLSTGYLLPEKPCEVFYVGDWGFNEKPSTLKKSSTVHNIHYNIGLYDLCDFGLKVEVLSVGKDCSMQISLPELRSVSFTKHIIWSKVIEKCKKA